MLVQRGFLQAATLDHIWHALFMRREQSATGEELMHTDYRKVVQELQTEFVDACLAIFGAQLVAIIAKGSTVRGGFIPGLSDLDLHVYLTEEAFVFSDFLKIELGLKLQEHMDPLIQKYDIGGGPIQVILLNVAKPRDWSGPLPDTYVLLYGDACPESEPIAEEMLKQDLENLAAPTYGYGLANSLADKSNDQLAGYVRRLNTAVNPNLFRVLSLLTREPLRVWKMTKFGVIEELERLDHILAQQVAEHGRIFYSLAEQHDALQTDPELCRQALRVGFRVLDTGRQLAAELSDEAAS